MLLRQHKNRTSGVAGATAVLHALESGLARTVDGFSGVSDETLFTYEMRLSADHHFSQSELVVAGNAGLKYNRK